MKRISLIMIALLTVSSVPAQDYQSYFEEFDVVLYQLQVNVRDRDGNHIPGLTKEDFQLLLEGKGQELETVEEINAGAWANAPADKPIPQQARRLFVLLFDLKYTTKQGALEARDSARSFLLEQLNPTDLVSVFSFDPLKGFAMITNFTSDQEHLLKAVDWLGLEDTQNVVQGPSGYFYNSRIDELQGELTSLDGNFTDPTGVDTGTGGHWF